MADPHSTGLTLDNGLLDAPGWLNRVRQCLAPAAGPDLSAALNGLSDALRQVQQEHAGLTEELLGVYEQLGIVFEVTRKLPTVQNETMVVYLFLDSLRNTYQGRTVGVGVRGKKGNWLVRGQRMELEPWLESLLDRTTQRTVVLVEPAPDNAPAGSPAEIMVGSVFAGDDFVCAIVLSRNPDAPPFRASDMSLLETLAVFCGDLIRNHRLVRQLRDMSVAMVRALVNAVDQKDEYTSGHSLRVAYYATMLARDFGLDESEVQMLEWSALLHDVGKIGIRDGVLKKEGKLTDDEFTHMKEHPVRSHKVVQQVPQLAEALAGVLHHHERYDGSGYPAGLKGEDIPLQARIIQIADVFDALTSNRSYRSAFSWEKALQIMAEEAGKTVDPQLQNRFDGLIRAIVENRPGAWKRLVDQASQFSQVQDPICLATAS